MKKISPLKAIRKFCLDCLGGSSAEVKVCSAQEICSLYPYRFGKNPNRKGIGSINNLNPKFKRAK